MNRISIPSRPIGTTGDMFIMPVQHKGPTWTKMETSASLEVLIALATELSRDRMMKLRILLYWQSEYVLRYYFVESNSTTPQHHLQQYSIFKTAFIPIILNWNKIFALQIWTAEDVVFLYWRNYSLVARARLARSDSTSSCQLISVPFDNNACPSSSAIKGKLVTVGRKLVFDKNTKIQNNQLWY